VDRVAARPLPLSRTRHDIKGRQYYSRPQALHSAPHLERGLEDEYKRLVFKDTSWPDGTDTAPATGSHTDACSMDWTQLRR
jgi:hypothetical protein